ncbi:hypothetical protein RHMOL_Rhmol07G0146200 [Rhododendron molle]|uniref:Uncharacterized protein n=1 Tax=Rhododendron molle TaxID=49168 RepID=A0ACC0N0X7_RHOML|nr:hypothetical protein RHMOL_Rhmol07G0146200 [Rhododendron molle]
MTSLCGCVHTISTNKEKSNIHHLSRRVNKIALLLSHVSRTSKNLLKIEVGCSFSPFPLVDPAPLRFLKK